MPKGIHTVDLAHLALIWLGLRVNLIHLYFRRFGCLKETRRKYRFEAAPAGRNVYRKQLPNHIEPQRGEMCIVLCRSYGAQEVNYHVFYKHIVPTELKI